MDQLHRPFFLSSAAPGNSSSGVWRQAIRVRESEMNDTIGPSSARCSQQEQRRLPPPVGAGIPSPLLTSNSLGQIFGIDWPLRSAASPTLEHGLQRIATSGAARAGLIRERGSWLTRRRILRAAKPGRATRLSSRTRARRPDQRCFPSLPAFRALRTGRGLTSARMASAKIFAPARPPNSRRPSLRSLEDPIEAGCGSAT